jgi:hypothetical protein
MGGQAGTISRDPPEPTKWFLRNEVGFGCPFRGCRKPFLTWHHFDPPWKILNHHNADGMIALCLDHHAEADAGQHSKEFLHALKRQANDVNDVLAKFPWARGKQLYRIGGTYFGGTSFEIKLGEDRTELIAVSINPQGMFELSFNLKNEEDRTIARMDRNSFVAIPKLLHDLKADTGKSRVKIQKKRGEISLELKHSRLSLEELRKKLEVNLAQKYSKEPKFTPGEKFQSIYINVPGLGEFQLVRRKEPERAARIAYPTLEGRVFRRSLVQGPHGPMVRTIEEPFRGGGQPEAIIENILNWSAKHCLDGDERISLVDLNNASFYHQGDKVTFRNHIQGTNATLGLSFVSYEG